MMSSPSTPPHISSSWSWPSSGRPRLDEEQGSFAEFSDDSDNIAIAIPLPTEVGTPTQMEIEQHEAPQIQDAGPQNSWSNSMPSNDSELGSSIMSYAVPIILGVAQLLIGLHLFGVF